MGGILRHLALTGALAGLAAAGLTACGWLPGSGSAAASAPPRAAQAAPHRPPAHGAGRRSAVAGADMVAAVSSGKGGVPVEVRFALRQRPEVGKPVELDVEVTPSAPLGKLVMAFHAEDGLAIQAGGASRESERPEPGVPLSTALTIVAQRDGIFYVDATVLVDAGAGSVARTFTIPVIAGAGAGSS